MLRKKNSKIAYHTFHYILIFHCWGYTPFFLLRKTEIIGTWIKRVTNLRYFKISVHAATTFSTVYIK